MTHPVLTPKVMARAALLLVDMNRSHLDHEMGHLLVAKPDADRIIDAAVTVRAAWAAAKRPVIFVRTHHRWNSDTGEVIDNRNPFWMAQHRAPIPGLAKPRKMLAVEGAVVTEVVPQLAPRPGEHTVFKHRYSPFHNTDLELLLKNLGTETLVIGGVNTNNCVLCTCFEAFNRDFRVVLMPDVCASMNGADYHDASLKLIEAALGWLVPSADVIAACSAQGTA